MGPRDGSCGEWNTEPLSSTHCYFASWHGKMQVGFNHGVRTRQEWKRRFLGQPDNITSTWSRLSERHLPQEKKLRSCRDSISLHSPEMSCGHYPFVYQMPLPSPSLSQLRNFVVRVLTHTFHNGPFCLLYIFLLCGFNVGEFSSNSLSGPDKTNCTWQSADC